MGGFAVALSPFNLLLMFVGVVMGIIIGVLPGLGGANGVAILLPLTFSLAHQPGGTRSRTLAPPSLRWGAWCGGAPRSILPNSPAAPGPVATPCGAHPLAQLGRAGSALTA